MQPDDKTLAEIEDFAIELARGAGQILEAHFGKPVDVQFKSDDKSNPVSQADKESEEFLKTAIKKRFPGHGIVGEEGTDEGPAPFEFVWVLDPLDGTLNYINGLPIYCVSIGVLCQGSPVVGAIWLPSPGKSQGSMFNARRGHGAFQDGSPISVRKNPAPQRGQLVIFHREFRLMFHRNAGIEAPVGEGRGPGSLAYEMAMTSKGVFQYSVFSNPKVWDVVAGVVLVQEAGGHALVYDRAHSKWQSLEEFRRPKHAEESETVALRNWSAPIAAGNRELVEYLARFMTPGRWQRFLRRLGLGG